MSTSRPVVNIPANTYVNLYTASSIVVGTKLLIQNIGNETVKLQESAAQPLSTVGHNNLVKDQYVTTADTPIGIWAMSGRSTKLQVEVA